MQHVQPSFASRCLALVLALSVVGCQPSSGAAPAPGPTTQPAPTEAPAPTAAPPVQPTSPPAAPIAAPASPVAATGPAQPAASPGPAAGNPAAAATPPEALPPQVSAAFRAIEPAVSRVRGLKLGHAVELRFMNPVELRAFFQDSFEREYSPEERARDQKLLVTLGLIRPDQNLADIILTLLSEEVLGLYDHDTRTMYVVGTVAEPDPSTKVTFAHEFVHALQDEQFGLKALNPPDSDNDDRSAAIDALVEGDATLAMLVYAQGELTPSERRDYARAQSAGGPSAFENAPLVLREELLFPYSDGLRFAQALHRRGGFAAIDAAFRNPPQSTEQILHPEKYTTGEAPVAVSLPDLPAALGGGWRQTITNTLGELDLRILVEQFSDRPTAERAAIGWGGDRYAFLEDDSGRSAFVASTTWDSSQDAWEFFQAYGTALRARYGAQARVLASEPERVALAGDGYAAQVRLAGKDVVFVLAPDEAVMTSLAKALGGG